MNSKLRTVFDCHCQYDLCCTYVGHSSNVLTSTLPVGGALLTSIAWNVSPILLMVADFQNILAIIMLAGT